MESILGTSIGVYFAVTFVVIGFAAWMTGAAVAGTWKPIFQVFTYCVLLACANRFLIFALFEGKLLTLSGFVIDVVILNLYGLVAFRINRVKTLVKQYPWLYERTSPWSFREKAQTAP